MDSPQLNGSKIQSEAIYPCNGRATIAQMGSSSSPGWFLRSENSQLCKTIDTICTPVVYIGACRTTKTTCQVEDSDHFQFDYFQFLWPFPPCPSRFLSYISILYWTHKIRDSELGSLYEREYEMYMMDSVVLVFLCLASLNSGSNFFRGTHLPANFKASFSLQLSKIPRTTYSLSSH